MTAKDASPEVLELIRHDAAHAPAEAAKELYPDVQVTIGPAIEDGFTYDFARDEPITPTDVEAMEARMRAIVARNEPITREVWDRDEAVRYFQSFGEEYKAEIIRDLPEGEEITIYRQGEFVDLCRGPHLPSTGKLGTAFKLTRLAGAYWRGDSRNAMLQRVCGTAWRSKKELDAYLKRLEEAARRDHRRLGHEMALFHFQEEATGAVFWHRGGATLHRTVRASMRRRLDAEGYRELPLRMAEFDACSRTSCRRSGASPLRSPPDLPPPAQGVCGRCRGFRSRWRRARRPGAAGIGRDRARQCGFRAWIALDGGRRADAAGADVLHAGQGVHAAAPGDALAAGHAVRPGAVHAEAPGRRVAAVLPGQGRTPAVQAPRPRPRDDPARRPHPGRQAVLPEAGLAPAAPARRQPVPGR